MRRSRLAAGPAKRRVLCGKIEHRGWQYPSHRGLRANLRGSVHRAAVQSGPAPMPSLMATPSMATMAAPSALSERRQPRAPRSKGPFRGEEGRRQPAPLCMGGQRRPTTIRPCSILPRSAWSLPHSSPMSNHRFVGLPTTIGVMATALSLSLVLLGLQLGVTPGLRQHEERFLRSIDFSDVLMQGMLACCCSPARCTSTCASCAQYRWPVAAARPRRHAALDRCSSASRMWRCCRCSACRCRCSHCLLFGALISPTDPIAVLGMLKSAGAPQALGGGDRRRVAVQRRRRRGHLHGAAGVRPSAAGASLAERGACCSLREAGGGAAFGLALGYVDLSPAARASTTTRSRSC